MNCLEQIATCALAVGVALPSMAQTYRWIDERGVTNYGEKAPVGRPAQRVDTRPGGTVESADLWTRVGPAASREGAPPHPDVAPAPRPIRGMGFDTYIRLQRGMTEGEVLLRAGPPDHESVENFRHDVVKNYFYYPTAANPFITTVTLRGGRIAEIERVRKSF